MRYQPVIMATPGAPVGGPAACRRGKPGDDETVVKIIKSFVYALSGIRQAFMTEVNMKIHLAAALLVIIVSILLLDLTALELAIIILSIFMVLVAEMFNTAMEAVIDLVTNRRRPLARVAKDVAAGAVLLAAVNAVVVAYLLIWPRVKEIIMR